MDTKHLYKKIDEFYGLRFADAILFRFNRQRVPLNSGAWQVLHLRCMGAYFLLLSIAIMFFRPGLLILPFVVASIAMMALSSLCYPELMRIHKIRIAAGRVTFSTTEGRFISESICQSQMLSGRQEKLRTAVAFGVPLAIMFLGMGLVSLVT